MSVEGEGSNEQKSQQQQSQQQQQQQHSLVAQDLNFSLNDILSNNHHDVNDSSFQSIVQTLSNNNNEHHITPSYAHLPAELQDLLSNEADDLLSTQGNNSDASILHGDMAHMWNQQLQPQQQQQQQQQQSFMVSPSSTKPSPSHTSSNISTPNISTPNISTQNVSTPQLQTPPSIPKQQQPQQPASSTTLLDNITSQLPPERKDRFIHLFRELQTSKVSADDFMSQARSLLGQQEYQQLENLKNKPAQLAQKPPANIRSVADDDRKRTLTSSQIRAEDAQRSMPGIITPQLKRAKTEHIPMPLHQQALQFPPQTLQQQQQMQHLQMSLQNQHIQMLQQQQQMQQQQSNHNQLSMPSPQQPVTPQQTSQPITPQLPTLPTSVTQHNSQPVFKTPAVPTTLGLQIPSKSNAPQITSKPTASSSAAAASSSGGGGDSRIDYEALTDVMGYTGVDLKEESELFMSNAEAAGGALPDGVDRSKVQDFMNTEMLRARILKYAKCVDIKEIDGDFVSYLALAAQDRIRTVMESMVSASKHRTYNPFKKPPMTPEGHPMFKIQVKQNVKLQLEAIERVARQTELDLDPPIEDDDYEPMTNEEGWYSNRSKKPLVNSNQSDKKRKITVQDAIFVMERDVQGGRGTNQKALLRAYSEYLS